jgi:glutamate N-acetyltransferase/amino-acid N-acetyltransferase
MKISKRAILPLGFKAAGISCGLKKSGKLDLALVYSQEPALACAKFTTNRIQAAPIIFDKRLLKHNRLFRAVLVNSGNANCFTGIQGLKDADELASALAKVIGLKKENILLASTGIIGRRLALAKIKAGLPKLVAQLSRAGLDKVKKAILTTDTFTKEAVARFNVGKDRVTVSGIAKGAGMIAPNMATMLGFIFTDARISRRALARALGIAVENSFNCITVDGCMSTNDSVIALANSAAENPQIEQGRNFQVFTCALSAVCLELARMIVKDAEGATKFIKIKVRQAKNFKEARQVALQIANSNLFKAAVYGENPNFGRIAAAAGASGASVEEKELKIKVGPLEKKEIEVDVSVGGGIAEAVIYTSDLTPEYIKINAAYN